LLVVVVGSLSFYFILFSYHPKHFNTHYNERNTVQKKTNSPIEQQNTPVSSPLSVIIIGLLPFSFFFYFFFGLWVRTV